MRLNENNFERFSFYTILWKKKKIDTINIESLP